MKILEKLWAAFTRRRKDASLVGAFRKSLGIGQADAYSYRLAMNHPLYQVGTPHPDDLDAFTCILGADMDAWDRTIKWVTEEEIAGSLSDGFFLIGSPEAEAITRLAFGYRRSRNGMEHLGIGIRLPFRWEEDGTIIKASYKRYTPDRGMVTRPNWPILDQRERSIRSIFPRLDNDGLLLSDLLLITKIPNFLTMESYQAGRSIVSVAGSHGPGTRAIELLLRDRKLMAQLGAEIATKHQGFQVLLEVGQIVHDPKKGSRGRQLEVRAVAPVDFPDKTWMAARRMINQRLPTWSKEVSG